MNEELLTSIAGRLKEIDLSLKILVVYLRKALDDDSPIKEVLGLEHMEAPKQGFAPRGRNKTYHTGLVGIDNLRQHYHMSEPYVVETCQKSGIHIEKIGKHWYIKKEDRQRVAQVCNLEPKENA